MSTTCYTTSPGVVWSNYIYENSLNFGNNFGIDTWNNSNVIGGNALFPIYNRAENIINNGNDLILRVTPDKKFKAFCSSISSYSEDILYGSFRISMKMTSVNGTNFGFFFHHSDIEEIDIEILAHEKNTIRTIVHPIIRDSNNVALNSSHNKVMLNKSITENFLEYRFDWFKDKVDFYVEEVFVSSLKANIPNEPGKLIVNHRTNGNKNWSRGPPVKVSDILVKYIELFYNTTTKANCSVIMGNNFKPEGNNTITDRSFGNENDKLIAPIAVGSVFGFIIFCACMIKLYQLYRNRAQAPPKTPIKDYIEMEPIEEKEIDLSDYYASSPDYSISSRKP